MKENAESTYRRVARAEHQIVRLHPRSLQLMARELRWPRSDETEGDLAQLRENGKGLWAVYKERWLR